ncbi:MAG: hypothetical protein M1291_00010 [Thaumarchaeota archaeon]|nr:hypothetical protein [Nitrososphaerota archaeon]MDG6932891.1 hypothetical protein [Nitrososphaerota archaeon]
MKIAIIDNGSALLDQLKIAVHGALGLSPEVLTYPDSSVDRYDWLVFSGRARRNPETDMWMNTLIKRSGGRPAAFICYAAEFLNLSRGGSLRRIGSHLYGLYDVAFGENSVGIPPGTHAVFESRSLSIARLGAGLKPIASGNGIEAFISDKGQLGLMFHPEMSNDFGLGIIRAYFMGKYF